MNIRSFADIPADVTEISAETYRQIAGNATSASDLVPRIAQDKPARAHPEADFRDQVVALARLHGWICYWTWQSKHSPAGFPDLVMVRGERLILAELKVESGKLSASQVMWIDALRKVPGIDVFAWKPSDWEVIEAVIGGGR